MWDDNKKLDETTSLFCGVIDEQFLLEKLYFFKVVWTFSVCKTIHFVPRVREQETRNEWCVVCICVPFFACQWGYNQEQSATKSQFKIKSLMDY